MEEKNNPVAPADRVPPKERIFYGLAALLDGGGGTLMSLVLLGFLNKGLGIASAVAAAIIFASKAWDAISDPLLGAISDNTRSKWGRRRPYLFAGGILIMLALGLLFAPIKSFPNGVKIAWASIAYIFYCTCSTVSQVPFCSLSSDISPDFRERNNVNTIKLIFNMVSAGLCYLIPVFLFENYLDGDISEVQFFLAMFLGFGIFFGLPLVLSSFFIKERTPYDPEIKVKFSFKSYIEPFKVKSYVWHLVMYGSAFICIDIISALAVYYATDVLRGVTVFSWKMSSLFIIAPMMVTAACMLPVVYYFMKHKSKQFAFRIGLPCYIIGGISLAVLPTSAPGWLVPVFTFIMGVGIGGAQMIPWLIFPDTVDIAELKYGARLTGSFSGLMTFSRKLATAIAILIVGAILTLSGEDPDAEIQKESVLIAVRAIMGISIVVLIGIAIFASFRYKVTNKDLERVRYFLDAQHNNALESLTDEEKAERQALIDRLA